MSRKGTAVAVTVAVMAALALTVAGMHARNVRADTQIEIGERMPNFTLPGVDGKQYTLSEALEKGPVVLNFSSQECPYSVKADPILSKLYMEYKDRNVSLLSIDSHKDTTPEEIKAYATDKNLSFPVLKDVGNAYADKVGAQRTPEVFLVNTDGMLVYHGGPNNQKNPDDENYEDYLKAALDEVLEGKQVTNPKTRTWGCTIKRAG